MVEDSNGRTASLLESAGPGTCRPPYSRIDDRDDALVRVPFCEGAVELRVPRAAVKQRQHHCRRHIEGFNADATPC